jgi:hypothetical protein
MSQPEREFGELKNHPEFEITTEYPWIIRNKHTKKVVNQWLDKSTGYYRIHLEPKKYYIHRLVAEQFLPKDEGCDEVDHISRCRTDNRLENLRFVSHRVNLCNKTSFKNVKYEYLQELPKGFEPFNNYKLKTGEVRQFRDLYVNFDDDIPQFISRVSENQWKRLYKHKDRDSVSSQDVDGKTYHICFGRINKTQNTISQTQATISETENTLAKAILNLTEILKSKNE